MEENTLEEIVDETSQKPAEETVEKTKNVAKAEDKNVTKVNLKNFKKQEIEESVTKVDLRKPIKPEEENEVKEDNADDSGVVAESESTEPTQEQKEIQPEAETQEAPVVEEITEEEEKKVDEIANEVKEAVAESQQTGTPLPENIQKLVDFMNETGGSLIDYVKLNQDFSKLNDGAVLREYYYQTKPHLDNKEINFLMEDQFSFDEEVDDEKDVLRKKLALKEQVANARAHLDGQKSKYYEEIKAGSRLTPEQKKAVDFFNRYKKTTEQTQQQQKMHAENFSSKTNEFFGDKFKGFEYNVGEKKYRFNVNNSDKIKEEQSNVNNFIGKFLNKKTGALEDAAGYHKSLFTAMNADAIAKHFYEQGQADAMKNSVAKSKNIDMKPRQSHGEVKNTGGLKFKVLGDDSNSLKWKIKNNK